MNTPMGFKLYDYVLAENGKLTGTVTKLGLFEAQKINFAYGVNGSPKRYILKSEVDASKDDTDSILIIPEG